MLLQNLLFHLLMVKIVWTTSPNYDNSTVPRNREVTIGLRFQSLSDFSSKNMDFDVDIYFRRSWKDPLLAHNEKDVKILADRDSWGDIWVPGVMFVNAKTAKFHSVTVPNSVMYIEQDGSISLSVRITMTVSCVLHLQHYPLDSQTCSIQMKNYAYPEEYLKLSWRQSEPININEKIEMAEFSIDNIKPETCTAYEDFAVTTNNKKRGFALLLAIYIFDLINSIQFSGKFSCLQAVIKLKRSVSYHVVQTYIPTGLIVTISWVSFWLDRNAVAARVSLSFTTLLTLSTMMSGLRYSLPAVAYAKAIELLDGYLYVVCICCIG